MSARPSPDRRGNARMGPAMMTTTRAAQALGVSDTTVRNMLAAGALPGAVRIGGTSGAWAIPADSVALAAAITAGAPDDVRELVDALSSAETSPTPDASTSRVGTESNTRGSSAQGYVTPAAPVESTRRTVEALATVRNRAAVALTDVAWQLLGITADPSLDPDVRDRLAAVLERERLQAAAIAERDEARAEAAEAIRMYDAAGAEVERLTCRHDLSSGGDEGPVVDLPGKRVVRWHCFECDGKWYDDEALSDLRDLIRSQTESLVAAEAAVARVTTLIAPETLMAATEAFGQRCFTEDDIRRALGEAGDG